ncbi:MAG TPA: winged helix-turn-helix transcriptional regulator [Methanocella sp.]|uniref:winged helix-turn-helix transcriptional regulator n=1 Tax=Methanocella sp. TaxID=2052833 RepID=UPI002C0668DF|nr:winged helix-turn-helix transcriptional regulator [Methanocella sp.]HTY90766.1 winged helix-turn-helix transcriptional regulator [Methanocella sp.]
MFPFVSGRLKHALENPKTKEIFYFIQRNPGMTIAELSEEQNMNRGTLKYHLSQLLTNNKIVFIRKGKFSRLFYNSMSAMDKESIISSYLRNEKSRDIIFTIMDTPGVTNQELSGRFDLAKSTTHEYLKSLSDEGIVEFRQDGKFKRCYIVQDARMILLRYRPQ